MAPLCLLDLGMPRGFAFVVHERAWRIFELVLLVGILGQSAACERQSDSAYRGKGGPLETCHTLIIFLIITYAARKRFKHSAQFRIPNIAQAIAQFHRNRFE